MKGQLRADSVKSWQNFRALSDMRQTTGGWKDRHEREAAELLQAALIYQIDGIAHYGERLHMKWRPPCHSATDNSILTYDEPSLRLLYEPSQSIGSMHIASAAVRLPVALNKTIEARSEAGKPFKSDY